MSSANIIQTKWRFLLLGNEVYLSISTVGYYTLKVSSCRFKFGSNIGGRSGVRLSESRKEDMIPIGFCLVFCMRF